MSLDSYLSRLVVAVFYILSHLSLQQVDLPGCVLLMVMEEVAGNKPNTQAHFPISFIVFVNILWLSEKSKCGAWFSTQDGRSQENSMTKNVDKRSEELGPNEVSCL